eukprot:COSAG01_NODE_5971_length_3923_cov_1.636435_3_plen_138_part_00
MNEDANTRLIRKLKEQVLSLQEQLAQAQTLASIGGGKGGTPRARAADAVVPGARREARAPVEAGSGDGRSHPFDTDYGRHLGEKVVESVNLLKRMVATNTQLRSTSVCLQLYKRVLADGGGEGGLRISRVAGQLADG